MKNTELSRPSEFFSDNSWRFYRSFIFTMIVVAREKLRAKMKLEPGPELFPTVETDEQLWGHLKKWDWISPRDTLLSSSNFRTSYHQFFVQREHGLMWCKVPKAASTSLLYAYLQLAHVPRHQIPEVRWQTNGPILLSCEISIVSFLFALYSFNIWITSALFTQSKHAEMSSRS